MKGNNPFIPWGENPQEIIGRKEELMYFRSFVQEVYLQKGGLLLIYGGLGAGKTTLLKKFELEAIQKGVKAIYIKCEKNEKIANLENKIVRSVGKIGSFEEMQKNEQRIIFLIDDFEKMRVFEHGAKELEQKLIQNNSKIGIVLTTKTKIEIQSNRCIEVKSFDEHETREFIQKSMHNEQVKMGDEFISTVFSDCNGNPKAIKIVCWHAFEMTKEANKVITKGQYLVYLPALMNMLSREWFGEIYSQIPEAEVKILLEISKADNGIHVSDIALKLKKPIGQITVLIGRLLGRGQIIRLDRGKYKTFCKLYSKFALDQNRI